MEQSTQVHSVAGEVGDLHNDNALSTATHEMHGIAASNHTTFWAEIVPGAESRC